MYKISLSPIIQQIRQDMLESFITIKDFNSLDPRKKMYIFTYIS